MAADDATIGPRARSFVFLPRKEDTRDGGCSGFSYDLRFDNTFDDKLDSKYQYHDVTVVVDKKSALYLDGTTVDFYEGATLLQAGVPLRAPVAGMVDCQTAREVDHRGLAGAVGGIGAVPHLARLR